MAGLILRIFAALVIEISASIFLIGAVFMATVAIAIILAIGLGILSAL